MQVHLLNGVWVVGHLLPEQRYGRGDMVWCCRHGRHVLGHNMRHFLLPAARRI